MPAGAALGLLLVACGGRGSPAPYETELTAPWTAMALPVAKGRVIASDELSLTVHFDGGVRDAQVAAWSAALEGARLGRQAEAVGPELVSITWMGVDQVVVMGVFEGPDRVEVALTRYPAVPAP